MPPPPVPPVPPLPIELTMPWWLDLVPLLPLLLAVVLVVVLWRQARSGQGFMRKQSDYLDHQRDVSERALDQTKAFEDMIASQYNETNARTDRALAQSDEALRLHAAALAELAAMNATLTRVAELLEGGKPQAPA